MLRSKVDARDRLVSAGHCGAKQACKKKSANAENADIKRMDVASMLPLPQPNCASGRRKTCLSVRRYGIIILSDQPMEKAVQAMMAQGLAGDPH